MTTAPLASVRRPIGVLKAAAVSLLLMTAPHVPAAAAEPAGRGDPPPAGALMRFGSLRLRHGQAVSGLAFSKDGKTLASSSWDRTVSLWELSSGKELRRFEGHAAFVLCVALSPDGKVVASGGEDFRLWDAATGKELHRLAVVKGDVWSVAFSPDGKLAACAGADGTVQVVEVVRGNAVIKPAGHGSGVRGVAFSPDGKALASVGYDNALRLWDVGNGSQTAQFDGHTGGTLAVAFSGDGTTVASGSSDGTVRLWDVATKKETKRFKAARVAGAGAAGAAGDARGDGVVQGVVQGGGWCLADRGGQGGTETDREALTRTRLSWTARGADPEGDTRGAVPYT